MQPHVSREGGRKQGKADREGNVKTKWRDVATSQRILMGTSSSQERHSPHNPEREYGHADTLISTQ